MKKHFIPVLILVLTAAVLTGCRSRQKPMVPSIPTAATVPQTQPETRPATKPTTTPTGERETIEDGNGPIPGQNTMPSPGTKNSRN